MPRPGVVASTGLAVLLALIGGGCRSNVPPIKPSDKPRNVAMLFEGFAYGGSVLRAEPIPTLNLNPTKLPQTLDLASEHAFLLPWSDQVREMDEILLKRFIAMGFHIDHHPWESDFVVFDSGPSFYKIRARRGPCSIRIAHAPENVPTETLLGFEKSNWEQAAYVLRLDGDCEELVQ